MTIHDGPSPSEILAAVSAYLREQVMPRLSGAEAFQLRVAANALDLVARQIGEPPETGAVVKQQAADLLGPDVNEGDAIAILTDRIASGEIGEAKPELIDMLWALTTAKLAVDQPRYAGYLRALERDANMKKG
jgi:hypothetical protein